MIDEMLVFNVDCLSVVSVHLEFVNNEIISQPELRSVNLNSTLAFGAFVLGLV